MVQPCPARIGIPIEDVETPALIVDLAAYENNLDRMAEITGDAGMKLRPHAKTHKSPLVALDQIARGAVGVCCQKVSEAEVMVQGGVRDVYVSNQVIGPSKQERLAALARHAELAVCVDDMSSIADLSGMAQAYGADIRVTVEIDVGGGRCGVEPGTAAIPLVKATLDAPGLQFGGLQAYHGRAQHIYEFASRGEAVRSAAEKTRETLAALEAVGIACPEVTGGGTGSLAHDIDLGLLNETQAGSYIFMDADYGRVQPETGSNQNVFAHSLFVLATVMSRAKPKLAVVDAGLKAIAFDSGPPQIWQRSGVRYGGPSDEHGELELEPGADLALGERLLLVPGHCDPTVNLYDWYVGVRKGRVERLWPVAARGALS